MSTGRQDKISETRTRDKTRTEVGCRDEEDQLWLGSHWARLCSTRWSPDTDKTDTHTHTHTHTPYRPRHTASKTLTQTLQVTVCVWEGKHTPHNFATQTKVSCNVNIWMYDYSWVSLQRTNTENHSGLENCLKKRKYTGVCIWKKVRLWDFAKDCLLPKCIFMEISRQVGYKGTSMC